MPPDDIQNKRTGPMTAVGVINLILGAFAAFAGGAGSVFSILIGPKLLDNLYRTGNDPSAAAAESQARTALMFAPAFALAMLAFGVLLMVSARGLMRMRPWARTMTLCLAWIAVAYPVVMIPVHAANGQWAGAFDFGGLFYWVLVIVLLMSREWKAAYAAPADHPFGAADAWAAPAN